MPRTITVKGLGKATAKPDYVVIFVSLDSRDMKYDAAMDLAARNVRDMEQALEKAGFEKDALKTSGFNVRTDYLSVKDKNGGYVQRFNGYVVSHNMKLEFDFDSGRLSQALSAISECPAHPQMSISFTVRDAAAVNEEMLRSATANARRKAEILCEASGVTLGELMAIDYNWSELEIVSNTRYSMAEDCAGAPLMAKAVNIRPDDINVSDTAAFVWEIR